MLGIRVEPADEDLSIFECLGAFSTDSIVKRKRSWQSSAKRQRVMVVQKQDTFEERVDFDGRLGDRECSLRTFASRAETTESTRVGAEM